MHQYSSDGASPTLETRQFLVMTAFACFLTAASETRAQRTGGFLDTEFWFPFPAIGTPDRVSQRDLIFRVLIVGDEGGSATVSVPGLAFEQAATLVAGVPTAIDIPSTAEIAVADGVVNLGVRVLSDVPVTVRTLAILVNGELARVEAADTTLILPRRLQGTRYTFPGLTPSATQRTQLTVTATSPGPTEIQVTLPVSVGIRPAGVPYLLNLFQGDVYSLQADMDFGGAIIMASQAVALTVSAITGPMGLADFSVSMPRPDDKAGRIFALAPSSIADSSNAFRLVGTDDDTLVNNSSGQITPTLNAGEVFEDVSASAIVLESLKPIQVIEQGPVSSFSVSTPADENYYSEFQLSTADDGTMFDENHLRLVLPTDMEDSVLLDGMTVEPELLTEITSSMGDGLGISWGLIPITPGSHSLSGPRPFSAIVLGSGEFVAYGHRAAGLFPQVIFSTGFED